MRVRQSDLKRFGSCAFQWHLAQTHPGVEEQVGSLTVLGTVWHFAVDVFETYGSDLDLTIRTFEKYWADPGLLGERIDFWHRRTTFESLRKRGVAMLESYAELEMWREGVRLGSEIHFVVPFRGHELEGTIDKLWMRSGSRTLEVLDFKTGSYVPEKLRHNIQFTTYCAATLAREFWQFVPGWEDGHETFAGWRRQGVWYHARNGRVYNAGFREERDYRRLATAIDQMENAITAGVFPLDYSGATCGYCPFVDSECGK